MYNSSPGFSKTTGVERKRKVEVEEARLRIRCKKLLFSSSSRNVPAEDYGPAAQRLDLEVDIFASGSYEVLKKSEEEVQQIERNIVDQSDKGVWLETQRNLLTASNFGQVCKMKPTTGCQSLVKQLRYSSFDCEVMADGRHHEGLARLQVGSEVGLSIELCGILIRQRKVLPMGGHQMD